MTQTPTRAATPPLSLDLEGARVLDLAHPMTVGMPQSPNHPSYHLSQVRRHGDAMRADGGSAANDILVTGTHVGTHMDALAHVSHDGLLHGGVDAREVQTSAGFTDLGIDTTAPFVGRGVHLDIAAVHGVRILPAGYEVTADDLEAAERREGVRVRAGDAVLIGTGWSHLWGEHDRFIGLADGVPGPGEAGARWLATRDVTLVGAETIAFEHIPAGRGHALLPAHRILLVESGINIIETMNLVELAAIGAYEFAFVVAPLPLVGATGSPVRPLAVVRG